MSKHISKHSAGRERARARRHRRVRTKVTGTSERPRLAIYRSNKHIYAQVIDDTKGETLAAASTLSAELKGQLETGDKKTSAKAVGEYVASLCREKQIQTVVFDRGGYLYTGGRLKALAEGARKGGLKF